MATSKKPSEAVTGRYTPIPHALLDSVAFQGASVRAKALLFELLRQHTGTNNGHLQLSVQWLKSRGWTSADQIQKAKTELQERGLIVKTHLGGLGIGPDRYALTWLRISDFKGLDLHPSSYHPGAWGMLDAPLTAKRKDHPGVRNGPIPSSGTEEVRAVPLHGTLEGVLSSLTVPHDGNNECCQLPEGNKRSRVVGRKGSSGIHSSGRQAPCH